jgi:hypothetical protein
VRSQPELQTSGLALAHHRGPQGSIGFVRLGTHRGRHNLERIDACDPKVNQVTWPDR